jgi:hypothetical protein
VIRRVIAAALAAAALSACTLAQQPNASASLVRAAADVALIAKGLRAVVPELGGVAGLDAATVTKIDRAIGDIEQVATAIGKAQTTTAARPLVAEVEDDLGVVTDALAGLKLPGKAGEAIAAAETLLPIVEVAVNLALPARARLASGALAPGEARHILAGAAR